MLHGDGLLWFCSPLVAVRRADPALLSQQSSPESQISLRPVGPFGPLASTLFSLCGLPCCDQLLGMGLFLLSAEDLVGSLE